MADSVFTSLEPELVARPHAQPGLVGEIHHAAGPRLDEQEVARPEGGLPEIGLDALDTPDDLDDAEASQLGELGLGEDLPLQGRALRHHGLGEELLVGLGLEESGEGGAVGEELSPDGEEVEEGDGDEDDAQLGDLEHPEVLELRDAPLLREALGDPGGDEVGGGADDGTRPAHDGCIGEGDEKARGLEVVLAAEGEDDGEEDDHHRGVIHQGGEGRDDKREGDEDARGRRPGDRSEPATEGLDDPGALQGRAEDEHAGDDDGRGVSEDDVDALRGNDPR